MTNYIIKEEKFNSISMVRAKRVYRWNPLRLLLNMVILVAIIVLMFVIFSGATKADTTPQKVIIHPGDTLWSIALVMHPEQDPRFTVETIRNVNHLSDLNVQPGQQILVP